MSKPTSTIISEFTDALNQHGPTSPEVLGYKAVYAGSGRLLRTFEKIINVKLALLSGSLKAPA